MKNILTNEPEFNKNVLVRAEDGSMFFAKYITTMFGEKRWKREDGTLQQLEDDDWMYEDDLRELLLEAE